jgi:hypothetical protein
MELSKEFVQSEGGAFTRILETLNGFHAKHGCWPTELLLDTDTMKVLREHLVTERGLAQLKSKVRLVPVATRGSLILAKSDGSEKFDYDVEGWSGRHGNQQVEVWLGFALSPESPQETS